MKTEAEMITDMFVERGELGMALRLACTAGLTIKAAQIAQKDFPMDR